VCADLVKLYITQPGVLRLACPEGVPLLMTRLEELEVMETLDPDLLLVTKTRYAF
jgi:hypothetical protein